MLRPAIIFVIITSTIGGLQIFDEPRMFDQDGRGGSDQQYLTVTNYIYQLGWAQKNFGRAAAVAWLLFLIIVIIGIVNYLITRRISSENQGGKKRKKARA
jgi:cellobiose transport system permease protein